MGKSGDNRETAFARRIMLMLLKGSSLKSFWTNICWIVEPCNINAMATCLVETAFDCCLKEDGRIGGSQERSEANVEIHVLNEICDCGCAVLKQSKCHH